MSVNGSTVVFKPTDSTYELHLQAPSGYDGPLDTPMDAILRGTARKVYTVSSGGLFITPIVGPTRILQGRVTDMTKTELAVKAVATVNVTLPTLAGSVELSQGDIADGSLVNVVLMPGLTFERATKAAVLTPPGGPL